MRVVDTAVGLTELLEPAPDPAAQEGEVEIARVVYVVSGELAIAVGAEVAVMLAAADAYILQPNSAAEQMMLVPHGQRAEVIVVEALVPRVVLGAH
jgi:glyoxylate utilization-related uncharacterized protein